MKPTSIKYLYLILLSLLFVACGEANKSQKYNSSNIKQSEKHKNDYKDVDSLNCDFLSSIPFLNQLSFQYDNNIDTTEVEIVTKELFEFLFNDNIFPSPQSAYFIGKFEIESRTGVVTFAVNQTESGKPMTFFQIHIIEDCKNAYTDFLALNDSDVMIYETEGELSTDFKTLTLINKHSSYEEVGALNVSNDTLFTTTYQIDLLTENFNKEIQPISIDTVAEYYYPNLTAWGGLAVRSKKGNLIEIEARSNAELGYTIKNFYLNNNKIYKIEYKGHYANWELFMEQFPELDYMENQDKMTYTDTSFTIDFENKVNINSENAIHLLNQGKEILLFLEKEGVLPLER